MTREMDFDALLKAAIEVPKRKPDYMKGFTDGEWGRYYGSSRDTMRQRFRLNKGYWVEDKDVRLRFVKVWRLKTKWCREIVDAVLAKLEIEP